MVPRNGHGPQEPWPGVMILAMVPRDHGRSSKSVAMVPRNHGMDSPWPRSHVVATVTAPCLGKGSPCPRAHLSRPCAVAQRWVRRGPGRASPVPTAPTTAVLRRRPTVRRQGVRCQREVRRQPTAVLRRRQVRRRQEVRCRRGPVVIQSILI